MARALQGNGQPEQLTRQVHGRTHNQCAALQFLLDEPGLGKNIQAFHDVAPVIVRATIPNRTCGKQFGEMVFCGNFGRFTYTNSGNDREGRRVGTNRKRRIIDRPVAPEWQGFGIQDRAATERGPHHSADVATETGE